MTDEKEITPQSNFVTILYNGLCLWNPRFDLSVTQCPVDITWYPFDEQKCDLVFVSWMLTDDVLHIEPYYSQSLLQPDGWYITSVY